MDRILADYLVESPSGLDRALRALASEGSTGTFVPVPGEDERVRRRFGTIVESVERLPPSDVVHLIGADAARCGQVERARVTISVPLDLTGTDLSSVGACLLGNVVELSEVSGLRLEDVRFPEELLRACPRPRFGVDGTRARFGVHGRPMFGSIVRPALGLRPDETAAAVRELLAAGIDFLKDDELMADPPYNRLADRIAAVSEVIDEHEQSTGVRAVYAFNITGEADAMLRRQDRIRAAGGSCAQVNLTHAGLAAVVHLRRHGDVVIHGHRSGWPMQTRCPGLGLGIRAYTALWRLAGVDQLIVSGLRNKYWEADELVLDAVDACLSPLLDPGDRALPVIAAGQWGGQIPDTYAETGTYDWLYLAGASVTDHPLGAAAGVRALHQAWEAARTGVPLNAHAAGAPELAASIREYDRAPTS